MPSDREFTWPLPKLSACSCGKVHTPAPGMPPVLLGHGAFSAASGLLQNVMGNGPFLMVADTNTISVANKLSSMLSGVTHTVFTFPGPAEASDHAVQLLSAALTPEYKGLLAVGSGSLTDVTRLVSFRAKLPFASFPTAASMDGYLSWGAPVVVEGYKLTYPTQGPAAVIADLDILAAAPVQLTRAGFGDVLGKYTSLADWQIGHLLTGEYYCASITESVERTLDFCGEMANRLAEAPEAAAEPVINALFVTGHAMICVGNSRPASGSEHHMSHYLEMRALAEGCGHNYHGEQVGVTCVLSAAIYRELLALPELVRSEATWATRRAELVDIKAREARVAQGFSASAGPRVLQETPHKDVERFAQLDGAAVNAWWASCRTALTNRMPAPEQLLATLRRAGAPATPKDLNLSPDWIHAAILYARELRPRLTILDVAAAAGELENLADKLATASFQW